VQKMRIKTTDDREQLWKNLCEATNEQAQAKHSIKQHDTI
jgi:hypothetical protein